MLEWYETLQFEGNLLAYLPRKYFIIFQTNNKKH